MSTFIISEIGLNHMGDMNLAKEMIYSSKECGCSAVKFQTYVTERRSQPGSELFDVLKGCELTYDQQTELKIFADSVGIEFFSTPFDDEALFFLIDRLGIRRIKLASFDVTNRKLLSTVNEYAKNLPALNVIMSTGMANYKEIQSALNILSSVNKLSILHCISSYPVSEGKVNLEAIKTLSMLTKSPVGYSDHTHDILVPALSVLVGAKIVEKHFTLDLENGAVDNPVSADPSMMKQMVEIIRMHEDMLGDGLLGMQDIEIPASAYRRY